MPLVELRGITKRFGSLVANDHIDLDIDHQEIQALLGENGAGKTTLMKTLYGMYHPDEGQILLEGKPVKLHSPAHAIAHGIGFVSQHFSLVPTFTVAQNIVLGREGGFTLNQQKIQQKVESMAHEFGFSINPAALVQDLSVGEQQRVEILKALYRHCRVLILDEPTAVLTPLDTEKLLQNLRELQAKHLSVIIITHKLEEAMAIAQRVTVLRQGKVVGRELTSNTNATDLARLMVGRPTVLAVRNTQHQISEQIQLEVKQLNVVDKRGVAVLRDVSFQVHAGEVVGIAGVAGNGQTELGAALNGMLRPVSGQALVNGQAIQWDEPHHFSRLKIGRIPEDRLKGVIGDLTVAQNLALETLEHFTLAGHVNYRAVQRNAQRLIEEYQIKAKPHDRVRTLSGGNIQKIILARTISQQPVVLIAAQPTRGLDVGATEYVHQKLLEQKERGAAVLLISEDLEEIRLLSDRILVIYKGQLVGEFPADQLDIDKISLLMMGSGIHN